MGSYVAYQIVSKCPGSQIVQVCVERRYSEFLALRDRVGDGPRATFPDKQAVTATLLGLSEPALEARRLALEVWLRQIVAAARRGFLQENLLPELVAFTGTWDAS